MNSFKLVKSSNSKIELTRFQIASEKAAYICSLLFIFFIPISPALMNISIFMSLVFILLARNYKNHLKDAWNSVVVKFALFLYLLIAIGILWSPTEVDSPYLILNKYNELWYLAILMPLFSSKKRQKIGINVFLASMLSILIMAYGMHFEIINEIKIIINDEHTTNLSIHGGFRTHIITGILMAFATYILANRMFLNRKNLIFYMFFSIAALYYIVYINIGTTGQILVLGLISLLLIQHFKWMSLVYIPVFFALILGYFIYGKHDNPIDKHVQKLVTVVEGFDNSIEGRSSVKKGSNQVVHENIIEQVISKKEIIITHPGIVKISRGFEHDGSSASQRREFVENSILIIKNNLWYGSGTGSFSYMYSALPEEIKNNGNTDNPHNEYAMIGVQLGLPGIVILIMLFGCQFYQSYKITETEYKYLAQGLAALIIVSSMGNSMILDSGEGHFWAFFSALLFAMQNDIEQNSMELED